MKYELKDIILEETCGACPEQYEAYIGDRNVGYLRLRHGYFRVDYPHHAGEVIYEAEPKGDGMFEDDERDFYLTKAKEAILERLNS